jgi:hypothetical protein
MTTPLRLFAVHAALLVLSVTLALEAAPTHQYGFVTPAADMPGSPAISELITNGVSGGRRGLGIAVAKESP